MGQNKKCIKCGEIKPSSEYYGVQGDCKSCVKERVKKRRNELSKDPEWVEKERKRHRDKYKRLGYKNKQKIWDEKRPWVNSSTYKNLNRNLKVPKGMELHHWNYNDEFLTDIVVLSKSDHKKAHTLLVFDERKLTFLTLRGTLLDTKEKHINYLLSNKISI